MGFRWFVVLAFCKTSLENNIVMKILTKESFMPSSVKPSEALQPLTDYIKSEVPAAGAIVDGVSRGLDNEVIGFQTAPLGGTGVAAAVDFYDKEAYLTTNIQGTKFDAGFLSTRFGDVTGAGSSWFGGSNLDNSFQMPHGLALRTDSAESLNIGGAKFDVTGQAVAGLNGDYGAELLARGRVADFEDGHANMAMSLSAGNVEGRAFARADGYGKITSEVNPDLAISGDARLTLRAQENAPAVSAGVGASVDFRLSEGGRLRGIVNGAFKGDSDGNTTAAYDAGIYRDLGPDRSTSGSIGAYVGQEFTNGKSGAVFGLRYNMPFGG